MESIPLPTKIELAESKKDWAKFIVEPCYPGYGTTLGNALRRVLLASLPGAAITAVKIEGVDHEFSTIPYIKEDIVAIILNLKLLRFKLHGDEAVALTLSVKGEKVVTAADFKGSSMIEVANSKQVIATLTDKAASLSMEIIVNPGRGYVPVENREKESFDVGWIAIDSVYTPIKTVNYTVEHVRVGQITNYDRLLLEIETDGTIKPEEALTSSAQILVEHFTMFASLKPIAEIGALKKKRTKAKKSEETAADATLDTQTNETGDTNATS